jgi:subtilisin family serine protease
MRRNLIQAVAGLAAILLPLSWIAPAAAQAQGPPASTRYIVTLGSQVGDVSATAAGLVAKLGAGRVVNVYQHALKGFAVDLPTALAPALRVLPGVVGIERNAVYTLTTTQTSPPSWGLDRVDQRNRPLSGTYEYTGTGAGVKAYIIDTGIRATHQDFGGRVVAGTNTADSSPSTDDCNGHGTHVAGTVGGATYGIAKGVTLVAVRVFGCGNSTDTNFIIAGVDWVTGNHLAGQPAVANMSLGGGISDAMDAAVRGMIADGVTTAIAAGNDGANACNGSPARVTEGIITGASDINDAKASFSNFGGCLDLFGPGVSITSAGNASDTATQTFNGTSQATPHVTGAAALYLATNTSASPASVQSVLVSRATPNVITGIKTKCNFLDNVQGTCMTGTPNLLLFTGTSTAPPPPPPPPPPCPALQHALGRC